MKSAKALTIDPGKARAAVKRHLQRLQLSNNGVQFQAQLYETEMVDILAGFARDPDLPAALRRQCAMDITQLARGAVRPWIHGGETIDPEAEGNAGLNATVGQEIEAAKATADLHKQLSELTAANVHPSKWPDAVRQIAGDMVEYYAKEDATVSKE